MLRHKSRIQTVVQQHLKIHHHHHIFSPTTSFSPFSSIIQNNNNNNNTNHNNSSHTTTTIPTALEVDQRQQESYHVHSVKRDVQLFQQPIHKQSDLLLRDLSFLVQDANDSERTVVSKNEQDRNTMLVYALKPVSLTDSQRRELVLHEPFSYVKRRVVQLKQVRVIEQWIQSNFFSMVFNARDMIDPHLVKCFINRAMLKKRERNLVYEFNRSNLQLEMQGYAHLDYAISRYLHDFRADQRRRGSEEYALMNSEKKSTTTDEARVAEVGEGAEAEEEENMLLDFSHDQQLTHIKSLLIHQDTLRLFAQSIGINDELLVHFQDFPQQKTGLDILMSIIGQTSNLIGVEQSRRLLTEYMIPALLQIIEENPVPEIKTEDLVRSLCQELYKQDPVLQMREYNMKFGRGYRIIYSTLVIVDQSIKGQGLANDIQQSKDMALRNAYDQLQSESTDALL